MIATTRCARGIVKGPPRGDYPEPADQRFRLCDHSAQENDARQIRVRVEPFLIQRHQLAADAKPLAPAGNALAGEIRKRERDDDREYRPDPVMAHVDRDVDLRTEAGRAGTREAQRKAVLACAKVIYLHAD